MVPPMLVLGHRIVWSVVLLAVLLGVAGQFGEAWRALKSRHVRLAMVGSTLMIAANWYTFIWAVSHNQGVNASFGYFINPLVNVLLGVVVLKERLRGIQLIAIGLAAAGVAMMTLTMGELPVVSLVLATSFGLYGLIRKTAPVRPLVGLSIETALLLPLAIAYVLWAAWHGQTLFAWGSKVGVLLLAGGVITALPLIWFAAAARRLSLVTLGLLQYVAPTCQLLIAVLVLGEPFDQKRLASFGLIWLALAVFSADAVRSFRRRSADRERNQLAATTGVPGEAADRGGPLPAVEPT
jgi:chloramphenicol-sensitive protein RarD